MEIPRLAPAVTPTLSPALGHALGGALAGAVTHLAPAPGPVDTYVPPRAAPPPAAGRPGILGRLPPPEDHGHDVWLIPVIIAGVLAVMAALTRLGVTAVRRGRPRPAGPD